jgi:hypothetical protein
MSHGRGHLTAASLSLFQGGNLERIFKSRFPEEKNMRTIYTRLIVIALTFGSPIPPAVWAADTHTKAADHLMVETNDLKWADVPTLPPGAKVAVIEGPPNEAVPFMMRLRFPANYKIPAHWHPAIEHLTVLSGSFNMGIGDKLDVTKTKALSVGGVMIIQPKIPHFAWTKEEVMVQVHGVGPWGITYVDPADDPKKK